MLLKGNEALALAAIRYGVDAYYGYPITPQSEIMETLIAQKPWESTGMTVLQAESEVAAINMVYGTAATGRMAMTSSSGPGISLMQNGISYLCGANLPCLIVNVMRGGPGLGTISPSQADYFQATRGGGHGDYRTLVLAPSSVQEMADFVAIAFQWAFRYRNPAMILADGTIGQMMEKVTLPPFQQRLTASEVAKLHTWASTGRREGQQRNIVSSLDLDPAAMELKCLNREQRYQVAIDNDARHQAIHCDAAEILIVAFGSAARICTKTIQLARQQGIRAGLFRPITLWPFPAQALRQAAQHAQHILVVELNAGQMIDDVRLALTTQNNPTQTPNLPNTSNHPNTPTITHYGRLGGVVFTPEEILNHIKNIHTAPSTQTTPPTQTTTPTQTAPSTPPH